MSEPITAEWLASVGFKWHQFDRQPDKQWLLWIGRLCGNEGPDSLGIELAPVGHGTDEWFCWLRSDLAHRYSRFIHVRHLSTQAQLMLLFCGLTGEQWDPSRHLYGSAIKHEAAEAERKRQERLDRRLLLQGHPWSPVEKDDTLGGALPEHLAAHEKAHDRP